ncbi:MAG: hypothetical protein WA441_12305 [Methyloceanibacter sp.]|jgi:hypothetical protein
MRTSIAAVIALGGSLLLAPFMLEPSQAGSVPDLKNALSATHDGVPTLVRRAVVVRRGYRGGAVVHGYHGGAVVRGPHGGAVVTGHRVGGRYYGGVWYGTGRRWYGGRWWPYGVGSCWLSSPIGYVWVCG